MNSSLAYLKATFTALLVVMVLSVPALGQSEAGSLTANDWQWVSVTGPVEQFDVEMPENYQLRFLDDGTISVTADCNSAFLPYTDEEGSLTVETGVTTLALCPGDSRSEQFVGLLGGAVRYFFADGHLFIDLMADGGTLEFAPIVPLTLTLNPWQWLRFTGNSGVYDIETPTSYLLTFNEDGTVNIVADCNNALGDYTDESGDLSMSVGGMTRALCPEGSRGEDFVRILGGAERYFIDRKNLFIVVEEDGGTLSFGAADAELMADDGEGAMAGAPLPPAEITNDEGGPAIVTGDWAYTSAYVARHFTEPVALLLDVSASLRQDYTEYVPRSGQIMGFLTQPLAPAPTAYEVNLPIQPTGDSVDVDNDGEEDKGVQIYGTVIGSNLTGDSYLEQIEQAGFGSYLSDPQTGAVRQGTFIVYAPDDQQGFPASAGEDGVFFTADDPAVGLPAGYTLATLTPDGQVHFDRSRVAVMDILESADQQSPDFSDLGILESYNALIDVLAERYAYTELRSLDWEAIRAEYLADVKAADADENFQAYYAALNKLALSIRDAHVYLNAGTNFALSTIFFAEFGERTAGEFGVSLVELSDGRFVVNAINPEGPAAAEGWQVGTEIVSVDGVPISEHVDSIPLADSAGNPDVIRLDQTSRALAFPIGTEVTIEYRQPEEAELRSVTMTATEGAGVSLSGVPVPTESISYRKLDDGNMYVQFNAFNDELYKIAVWEKMLSEAQGSPGLIIDLRHNGGGSVLLMYALASYLFTADNPAQVHWFDEYVYDEQVGDLVKSFATDQVISAPKPELAYTGAVVVLVGENSASAAEYFPQYLQTQGRAIVVGEHGTEGAGGVLETAQMPGGFSFYFTKGRSFFVGTDELNLEAKGVSLDVRVPVTLDNELAKQAGEDIVLQAGIEALAAEAQRRAAERIVGTSWQLTTIQTLVERAISTQTIETPEKYTITFVDEGAVAIQADCNQVMADYELTGDGMTITPGPATLALCDEGSLGEQFVEYLAAITSFQFDGEMLGLLNAADPESFFALEFAPLTEEPIAEPTEEMPAEQASLMDNDWQWVSYTGPVEQFEVAMPENYQLRFLDDGTISVTADCNSAFLPYTDEEGSLTVETGVMTLALCPGDSRSEQFVGLLGGAARYFFADGHLFIDLMADGGTLEFAPIAPLTLTSNPWQWLRFTGNAGVYDIETPESYLLTFNEDGTVNIVADCNNAVADYTDENGNLTITVGPMTLALCPGDSRGEEFVQILGGALRYFIDGQNLFIVVEEDGGTLSFGAADS